MRPKRFSIHHRRHAANWGLVNDADEWAFGSTASNPAPNILGFHTRKEALNFIETPEIWGEPATITFQAGEA